MDFALREWRQSDAAGVAKYANNGKIACNLRDVFPHPYTLTDAEYFVTGTPWAVSPCAWAVMCTPGPPSWATGWRRSIGERAS